MLSLCEREDAVQIYIDMWLFSLFISTSNHKLYNWLEPITRRRGSKYTNGRQIGLRFFSNALWVSIWEDPMESRGKDPRWWRFHIDFADLILGKRKHTREVLQSGQVTIDMPEGEYPATYEVERRTWKRPRWPFPKVHETIDFDIPAGIPHEGKGENSWDCGMDATFGIGVQWEGNINKAAESVSMRCLQTRKRYGRLADPSYGEWRTERLRAIAEKEAKNIE